MSDRDASRDTLLTLAGSDDPAQWTAPTTPRAAAQNVAMFCLRLELELRRAFQVPEDGETGVANQLAYDTANYAVSRTIDASVSAWIEIAKEKAGLRCAVLGCDNVPSSDDGRCWEHRG